ncbi:TonB-dependent receptor plug domain-containing protein [Psychrosphaera haliotis]|uniref:TonB-dependent receptor n=1 Tax=Psychrosphaera haliotis TaxID=555083 RepID=A0A6N8FEZ1_9GAMM|nr:TonB-dependent receptor [Psychrosphaera haliotis]MUH73242.1 TonB-dependent receptor [Psychrosphaera haliotis]
MSSTNSSTKMMALSLAVASALGTSPFALANENETQDALLENVEVISVTGTRRSLRSVAESTVPVDIITGEDLQRSGLLEMSQVLSGQIPSFNYPSATLADGTDHARPAVLRGLAPDHTLVLINGKRRHSGALLNLGGTVGRGSSAVDLNMIPTSAIKRVEVLRDGAAAQYGSDAIAGVINIVLKDASEGGSVSLTYGEYDSQMAGSPQLLETGIDANGNLDFTKGSDKNINDGATRTFSANSGFALGEKGFVNVSLELRNNEPTNRSGIDEREQYDRLADGSLDPRELTIDRYNHRFGKADIEDMALFYNLGYALSDSVDLYSFGSYSDREGNSGGFYRRAKDSRNVESIYADGFLPQIVSDVKDYAFAIGVNGDTNDWTWDVSANYGLNDFGLGVTNSLNTSLGENSPTSFDNGALKYQQIVLNADANTSVDFGLPDVVYLTVGAEYRHENYQIEVGEEASYITATDANGDPIASGGAQVLSGFSPDSATDESRHNVAVFAELDTYLTDSLNVVLAGRFEDYSDFGSTFTSKLATRYSVTDDFSIRGAISTGFRAPSLAQTSYKSISTVFEDGIPKEVGLFPVTDDAAVALGAQELEAEESVNATAGFIYTYDDFTFTVDAYQIKIDDRIVLSENLSGAAVVDILQQAGETNAQSVRYFTNAIDSTTKGVDIVATYRFDLNGLGEAGFGSLTLNAAANINDTEVTHIKDNPAELAALGDSYQYFARREVARFEQGTPKNKVNLSATWDYNDWSTTLRATRYGEVVDVSSNPDNDEVLAAKWITDVEVSYQANENWTVSVGANNLFDQYPQDTVNNIGFSNFNQIFTYSPFTPYSLDGRFVYGNVSYRF